MLSGSNQSASTHSAAVSKMKRCSASRGRRISRTFCQRKMQDAEERQGYGCTHVYICLYLHNASRNDKERAEMFVCVSADDSGSGGKFLIVSLRSFISCFFYIWNTQMYFLVKTNFKRSPEVFSVKSPNVPLRPSEFRDVSSSALPVRKQQRSWILCLDLNSGPKAGVTAVP